MWVGPWLWGRFWGACIDDKCGVVVCVSLCFISIIVNREFGVSLGVRSEQGVRIIVERQR